MRGRHHLDGGPRQRRNLEQDIERLAGQTGETASEQLPQAVGNTERLARRGSRARADELATELESEERVARRRLLHARELGPCQLRGPVAARADDAARPRSAGRPRSPQPIPREGARRARTGLQSRPQCSARSPEVRRARSRSRRSATWSAADRGRVEPLHVVERDQRRARARPGASARRARQARSHARPERRSPGSASRAPPRAPAVAAAPAMAAASSSTGESSSESPAKESVASASTPRRDRTRPNRSRASSTPASHRIVLPIPGSPERTSAAGPCSTSARNAWIVAKLLVAPDDLGRHWRYTSATSSTVARRAASPARRTPSFLYTRERCISTVLTPMNSAAAISLFERPSAASSATRARSRSAPPTPVGAR